MARPGDKKYRHSVKKDLQVYYQRAGRRQRLALQRYLAPLATLILRLFGTRIVGRENIPEHGPIIIAPSHSSLFDPFFFAFLARRRALRFVAKSQLFTTALAPLLLALGAFPIRRGHYDQQAFTLCRQLLQQGQAVLLFPQGGVHRQLRRDSARWGLGLVGQENDVPIIPVLIAHRGLFRRKVIIGRPITVANNPKPSAAENQAVAEEILAAIIALQETGQKEKTDR